MSIQAVAYNAPRTQQASSTAVKDLAVKVFGSLKAAGAALAPLTAQAQREGRYPFKVGASAVLTVLCKISPTPARKLLRAELYEKMRNMTPQVRLLTPFVVRSGHVMPGVCANAILGSTRSDARSQ
jgi:hypothetical protein